MRLANSQITTHLAPVFGARINIVIGIDDEGCRELESLAAVPRNGTRLNPIAPWVQAVTVGDRVLGTTVNLWQVVMRQPAGGKTPRSDYAGRKWPIREMTNNIGIFRHVGQKALSFNDLRGASMVESGETLARFAKALSMFPRLKSLTCEEFGDDERHTYGAVGLNRLFDSDGESLGAEFRPIVYNQPFTPATPDFLEWHDHDSERNREQLESKVYYLKRSSVFAVARLCQILPINAAPWTSLEMLSVFLDASLNQHPDTPLLSSDESVGQLIDFIASLNGLVKLQITCPASYLATRDIRAFLSSIAQKTTLRYSEE